MLDHTPKNTPSAAAETGPVRIVWLGQGGFLLETEKCRLLIDPYISDCIRKAEGFARLHPFPVALSELKPDLLLVTHDHMDHLDPEGVPRIREIYPACRFAGPERSFAHFLRLGIPENMVSLITVGEEYRFGPFSVTPFPALHSDPSSCGYLIAAAGKKIVLTGDTRYDSRPPLPMLRHADLLLICINGKLNNMNADEALRYTRELSPAAALPMHFGLFAENTADPTPFITGCRAMDIRSFEPSPGIPFSL